MKKILLGAIMAVAMLLTAAIAHADVIFGPVEPNDSFFLAHRNEIRHLRADFIVDSANGPVTATAEPGSGTPIRTFKNGEKVSLLYAYFHRGAYYACHTKVNVDDGSAVGAWILP